MVTAEGSRGRSRWRRRLAGFVLTGYLTLVLFGTLGPAPSKQVNEFGRSLHEIRTDGGRTDAGNLEKDFERAARVDPVGVGLDAEDLANVAIFLPIVGVVAALQLGRRWWIGLPLGVALSFVIEGTQLWFVTHRSPQWQDVRWNCAGVVIGFVAVAAGRSVPGVVIGFVAVAAGRSVPRVLCSKGRDATVDRGSCSSAASDFRSVIVRTDVRK